MDVSASRDVPELVEHLFRRQAGRMLSSLCAVLGLENLDLAEEVVQEALIKALTDWPYRGIPENPRAWLARTARNLAIDALRRQARFRDREQAIAERLDARSRCIPDPSDLDEDSALPDDQLAMIFACCRPEIPLESRLALTLKTVSGLGVGEIARAFLASETTIAQRIVRAKRRIEELAINLALPAPEELGDRLDSVLHVLYILFNEGYSAAAGENLIRLDLCEEAIRLARLLARRPDTGTPRTLALAALFLLQASRLPARVDHAGDLLPMAEQDRSLWSRELISEGLRLLSGAASGDQLSSYHLLAGIAAEHAVAATFHSTNWAHVLDLYDMLVDVDPSPIVKLNRVVAVAMAKGAQAGLDALDQLGEPKTLRDYYLLPATRAELLSRQGRYAESREMWRRASEKPCSAPIRRFIEKRLAEHTPPPWLRGNLTSG